MTASDKPSRAIIFAIFALLAGCAVGPNFTVPVAPEVERYTAEAQPSETIAAPGGVQKLVRGGAIAADWWKLFDSPPLNQLIDQALLNNQQLKSAQASLRQSREQLAAARGILFPTIDANVGVSGEKFSSATYGGSFDSSTFALYSAGATVDYNFDLFGAARRGVESIQAQVDQQRYQTVATYLTLVGNVINTAIATAAFRARIAATEDTVVILERQLAIVQAQVDAGIVGRAELLTVRSALATVRADLPPLRQGLAQARHVLAVLLGGTPAQVKLESITLDAVRLPQEIPVSLPSDLVRQRPDILIAQAQLHAASANIGVATAALYPQLSLSGELAQNSLTLNTLFSAESNLWTIGGTLTAPIFHGGTLRADRRAAIAAYQATLADYHQTVLTAFAQVADVLRALQHDAEALQAQSEARTSAKEALALVQQNYQAGIADYLEVLVADRLYQQSKLGYIQAQTQRYQDTVALFAAVGGGWWNKDAHGG